MAKSEQKIIELKSIGPSCEEWLNGVGIYTRSDLEKAGIYNAYRMINKKFEINHLMLLYALHSALNDMNVLDLPPEIKIILKEELKNYDKTK